MSKNLTNISFSDFSTAVKKTLDYKLDKKMERSGVTRELNKYEECKKAFDYVKNQDNL